MSKILAPIAFVLALQSPNTLAQEGGVDTVKDTTHDAVVETMKNVEGIDITLIDPLAGLSEKEREIERVARKAFNTIQPNENHQSSLKSKAYTYDGLRVLPNALSTEEAISYNARLAEKKSTYNKRQRELENRYEAGDASVKIVGRTASGDMLYEVQHTPKNSIQMGVADNRKFGVGVQPTLQFGTETLQLGLSGTISKDQKNALIALGWQFSESGVITLSASTGAENAQKAFAEEALDGDKNLKARTFGIRLDLAGIGPIARTRLEVLHTEVPRMFLGQTSKDTVHIRIEDLPTVINTLKDTITTTTHYSSEKATHTTARLGGVIEVGNSGELSLSLGAVSSHIGAESSVHPSGTVGYTYYGGGDKFEIGARYTGHSTGIDAKYTRKLSDGVSAFIGGFADKGTNGYSNSGVMVGLSATFGGPENPTPYIRPGSTHPHVEHIVGEVLTDTQYRAQDIASLTHLHKEVEVHTHTATLSSVSKILFLSPANEIASTPHNTPITLNLLANDTTPNAGGALAIIGTPTVTHGTLTLSGGSVTVTPDSGYVGVMVVTYTVSDGKAANITETATITVGASINQPPTANPDTITTAANTPVSFSPLMNDTDPENNTLSLVSATSANGTITQSGNVITFTPNGGFTGVANILYTITDGVNQVTGNTQVTVNTPVDITAPTITLVGPTTLTLTVGDTYTEQGATWTDAIDGSGTVTDISGTVDTSTPGSYTVTYSKTDAAGNPRTLTRTITVNAPVASWMTLPDNTIIDTNGSTQTVILANVSSYLNNPPSGANFSVSGVLTSGAVGIQAPVFSVSGNDIIVTGGDVVGNTTYTITVIENVSGVSQSFTLTINDIL